VLKNSWEKKKVNLNKLYITGASLIEYNLRKKQAVEMGLAYYLQVPTELSRKAV